MIAGPLSGEKRDEGPETPRRGGRPRGEVAADQRGPALADRYGLQLDPESLPGLCERFGVSFR